MENFEVVGWETHGGGSFKSITLEGIPLPNDQYDTGVRIDLGWLRGIILKKELVAPLYGTLADSQQKLRIFVEPTEYFY